MKRIFLLTLVFLLFIPSHVFGAQKVTSSKTQERKKGRFQSEVEIWKKGLAAAKKKHWHRKQLTAQESSAYKSVLKRVGLTALLALIGVAIFDTAYYQDALDMETAAQGGDVDTVRRLLAAGLDPNAEPVMLAERMLGHVTGLRATPLYQAIISAHRNEDHSVAVVRELIAAGATIPENVFFEAVKTGFPDLVEVLVDGGAPIDATDREGKTALDIAREMQDTHDDKNTRKIIKILSRHIHPTKSAYKK